MKESKLIKRFKIWIVHKCGGKFPYEYNFEKDMRIVRTERPFIHLKNTQLMDTYQYETNPDAAVEYVEKELAYDIGEAMRNNGCITYSYELLHYGYAVTAEAYVAKGEKRVI